MCNKLFSLCMLVFVIGSVVIASGTAEPNLVAWYRFDEGTGTTANDLSGNNYDATVSTSSKWASDDYGYHLSNCSQWSNLYVDVPSGAFSTVDKQITVSMWICNPTTDYGMGGLIKASALSQGKDNILSMSIYNNGSTPASYYFVSTAGEDSSGNSDTQWWWGYNSYYSGDLEEWHHVAMIKDCDAEIEKLYYDGVQVANYTCDGDKTMAGIENCRIFTRRSSGTNNWYDSYHGKMADIKIFDRALSAAEISEQAGNSLVAWWKFEETSGFVAHDSSACRYDGTLGSNNSWDGGVVMTGDNYGASKVAFDSNDVTDMFSSIDDQISIAFWAKNDFDNDSGHNRMFFGKNSSGTSILMAEWPTTGGDLNFKAGTADHIYFDNANDPNSNNYVEMDGWHHYVLVKDADRSRMWIYMDGYKLAEITNRYSWEGGGALNQSVSGITSFEICGSSANWHQFAGTIRDFRIYNTALEPLDVRDIYNQYAPEFNNTYYVDAVNGSDTNNGTSPSTAWKNLSKLNATTFQPLDKILLKVGCTWTGSWTLKGSGNPGEPIVVGAYGGDVSNRNNKPRINNTSTWQNTIIAKNVEWWEINNLHITHHPASRTQWISAVGINADNFGKMDHIHLKDCYIHDVYGQLEVYGGGHGIKMSCNEHGDTESWLNDILIEGCYFETVDNTGVHGGSNPADGTRQPATNVVIRDNYFTDMGGAAVIPLGCDGALVEYNVVTQAMKREGNCAIWPFASDNTIVQYNEVYQCDDRGDGEAYDCDYQCDGTIFQYNYSHDNPGGFMRICVNAGDGNYNTNNTVRYNISINDGDHDDAVIELWKFVYNTKIYNNIIYLDSTKGTVDMVGSNKYGGADGGSHYWWNNIWVAESGSTGRFAIDDGSSNTWSNNTFHGDFKVGDAVWIFDWVWVFSNGTPSGSNVSTSDPKFVDPGEHAVGSSLSGYKLQSTSPCLGTGLSVSNNGGLDYWGNYLYNGSPDRGAQERP